MRRWRALYVCGCIASVLVTACSLIDLDDLTAGSMSDDPDAEPLPDGGRPPSPDGSDGSIVEEPDGHVPKEDASLDGGGGRNDDADAAPEPTSPCEGLTTESTPFLSPRVAFPIKKQGGTLSWTTPDGALTKDDSSAQAASSIQKTTEYLSVSNLTPGLPSDARISGFEIEIIRFFSNLTGGAVNDDGVVMTLNGQPGTAPKKSSDGWTSYSKTVTYGGPTETFGITLKDTKTGQWLTGADANSNPFLFGAAISVVVGGLVVQTQTANVDSMRVKIHYCRISAN